MDKKEIVNELHSIMKDCIFWGDANEYEKQNG